MTCAASKTSKVLMQDALLFISYSMFKHQSVFNLTTLLVQSLEDWTEDPDTDLQIYCGQYPTNYDIENNVLYVKLTDN